MALTLMRTVRWIIPVLAMTTAAAQSATTRPALPPGSKPVGLLHQCVADLEHQIAQRNINRLDLAGDALAVHETGTDLLVFAHALANQGTLSRTASDAQILTWLRARELQSAAAALQQALAGPPAAALTAPQRDAMKTLHQLTFRIDPKSTADVDVLCAAVGAYVLRIGSPEAPDPKTLPMMRPELKSDAPKPKESAPPPPIAQLMGTIQTAAITPQLRGQLLALALVAADPAEPDTATLHKSLADLVRFTKSLENHIAVATERRQQIENQLAETLALFNDRRTREAARKRLDALDAFGQLLARIDRLTLSGAQKNEIAPSLVWANESETVAPVVVDFLERYTAAQAEFDAARKTPVTLASLKKPADDLGRQFAQHRKDFWTAAVDLPQHGDTGIDVMRLNVEEMERLKNLAGLFGRLPAAQEELIAYRPRPGGGLEKRIQSLAAGATAVGLAGRGGPRSAGQQLELIVALATVAADLSKLPLRDVPADIATTYAGESLNTIETRWRAAVTDAASASAGGADIDRSRIVRLERLHRCLAALTEAAEVERALAGLQQATGWVDWTANVESAGKLLDPYRLASSTAISAFGTDNGDGVNLWLKSRQRYAPLMAIYRRAAVEAAACGKLPAGVVGAAAQLRTPIDQQPFGPERYASFMIDQWTLWSLDFPAEADALIDPMCRRLAKEMGMPADEPESKKP